MIQYKFTEIAKQLTSERGLDFTPTLADAGSSGYDLRACIPTEKTMYPDEVFKFPTGVHIWIGDSDPRYDEANDSYIKWAGLYLPRSSCPGLRLENTVGLLDCSYQGESFLKYRNVSQEPVVILPGEKIGQLIFLPTYVGKLRKVESFNSTSARGEGGFGSSGRV
jgi:dUTP pyrophosphatase